MILISKKLSNAFTIAEILIVMGIIGIIAEMTIPSMMNQINNKKYVSAVLKYQSILQNVIQEYMIDSGSIGNLTGGVFNQDYDSQTVWNGLKKYFIITKDCNMSTGCAPSGINYKYLNGSDWANLDTHGATSKAILQDGSILYFWDGRLDCQQSSSDSNSPPLNEDCGAVFVDVNGLTPPNQLGRDLFEWRILKNGTIMPAGTRDDSQRGCDPSSNDITGGDGNGAAGFGVGCTERIIRTRAMDY